MKFNFLLLFITLLATPAFAEDVDLKKELASEISQADPAEVRTYKSDDGSTVTEYKSAGRVWMIKVQPAGDFPAYYLYDDEGNGTFERHMGGNKKLSPPMWIIKRF